MDQIRTLLSRCASFFRRQRLDEDLDQELRSHIQFAMEENMQRGMPEQDARTAALRAFGGSVVVLELPAELRGHIDVWGCDSNALPLMREIKRRFDPDRILNPGRFAGNI